MLYQTSSRAAQASGLLHTRRRIMESFQPNKFSGMNTSAVQASNVAPKEPPSYATIESITILPLAPAFAKPRQPARALLPANAGGKKQFANASTLQAKARVVAQILDPAQRHGFPP